MHDQQPAPYNVHCSLGASSGVMIQSVRFIRDATSSVAVPLRYFHQMEETTSSYSTLRRETRSIRSNYYVLDACSLRLVMGNLPSILSYCGIDNNTAELYKYRDTVFAL